ncbi:MAG: 3-dehydroquinate synthase [Flavobacteriaceae bacterium]|nr:3-dehydroquinate synthase [Flavobacteriaceae bacterium]
MKSIQSLNYSVVFNKEGHQELSSLLSSNSYSKVFILVDKNTKKYCLQKFKTKLNLDFTYELIEINSGEINKNLETCIQVWNHITNLGGDRKSVLITLGGGVITDLGGFVASCFKRGIDFINIPTTLLSMVDASVGGKTGVDLGVLKNQIGLFANPKMVVVDEDYLETLAEREIKSGTAEIIKYGLTYDKSLFDEISTNNYKNINTLIYRSIEIKNEVVLMDPKENYLRKVLNFGHTLGHAIESYFLESTKVKSLTHGEAIAIGMVCESYLSTKIFDLSIEKLKLIKKTILEIYTKVDISKNYYPEILSLLKHDKKNVNGQINFVLLNDFEDYKIDCKVSEDLILESLDFYNS